MTARNDLLVAARSLAGAGRGVFSPAELIAEARRLGSTYPDSTLRTHILGPMCANSPDHHSVRWGDLVRVDRGRYRLAGDAPEGGAPPRPNERSNSGVARATDARPEDPQQEWHWEGNVQAAVVAHLASDGWQIRRVADTATREQGHDIEAVRGDQTLAAEVKGFPSARYVRGPKRGQPKPTSPGLQARHWFAGAVLTALLARDAAPEAKIAIALPDFETYRSLARRTRRSRAAAEVEIWLVGRDGRVNPEG